jgi:Uma2 family endonuclease
MGVSFQTPHPMTADEFFAFTATRPDGEKWELIDGEPIMTASPTFLHQVVVTNLIAELRACRPEKKASWTVIPGIGVRLSETSVPVPDVLIRPNVPIKGSECDDMIIAFEVLSPSTADRDLHWKRESYADLPSVQQYVVLAHDRIEIRSHERARGFVEQRLESIEDTLVLSPLNVSLPVRDIYADTGL